MDGGVVDARLVVCCFPVTFTAQNYTDLAIVFNAKENTRQEQSSEASGTELALSKKLQSSKIPQNHQINLRKCL